MNRRHRRPRWLNLRGRGCPGRAGSHSHGHPRESRWSSIGWSPMIFLRPGPAPKTWPMAASCVASSHAASGASTPRWEYHQEWTWLLVIVLAGMERAVVHTNCGYLRLCMPRCMHKLGGQQSSSMATHIQPPPDRPNSYRTVTNASIGDPHK
jgi:hypothetical protein